MVTSPAATTGATWEYDGTTWTQANGPANPVREACAFTFDAGRRRALLFGGNGPSPGGTYECTTAGWNLRTQAGPPDRSGGVMVYDQVRSECVLFGGSYGSQQFGDTWRYRVLAPAIATAFGQGCGGSGAPPGFLPQPWQLPYLGMSFGLSLYSLPANQPSLLAFGWSRRGGPAGQGGDAASRAARARFGSRRASRRAFHMAVRRLPSTIANARMPARSIERRGSVNVHA